MAYNLNALKWGTSFRSIPQVCQGFISGLIVMAKIFISYKRNVGPDTPVATAVFEALRQEHEVFIDTTIQVGEKWAQRIQKAIKNQII